VVTAKCKNTINIEEPDAFNRAVGNFLTLVEAGKWGVRNPASLSPSAILPAEEK